MDVKKICCETKRLKSGDFSESELQFPHLGEPESIQIWILDDIDIRYNLLQGKDYFYKFNQLTRSRDFLPTRPGRQHHGKETKIKFRRIQWSICEFREGSC